MSKPAWWSEGVHFQCQGSGKCCTSRGEYGFVFLSLEDRRKLAKKLGLTTAAFTRKHCEKYNGAYHLIEDGENPDCMFLEGNRCGVYEARPTQCRTWPFWPEVMNAKTWKKEVLSYCPGVGKGPKISVDVIQKNLQQQQEAEDSIIREAQVGPRR
jgi:Fe-S-cluster containining protein